MATPAKIRADDQIQQDVLDELSFDARVQPNEVGVIVKMVSSPLRLGRFLPNEAVAHLPAQGLIPGSESPCRGFGKVFVSSLPSKR
jgi:hypothetical protein